MTIIGNRIFDSCDVIKEVSKDGTELATKYVLYKKDGTEVLVGGSVRKLTEIDQKIAELEAEKAEIVTLKSVEVETK